MATFFQVGLSVVGWIMRLWKSKADIDRWLKSTAETLHKKGMVRQEYLLKLEKSRRDRLNNRLDKLEAEEKEEQ